MHKVLLILESEDYLFHLQTILSEDYTVTACLDTRSCPELLSETDAMILDLFLPGQDGLSFLLANRDILPPVVIVLTRYIDHHIGKILQDLGVSMVFRTPCRTAALIRTLEELLT